MTTLKKQSRITGFLYLLIAIIAPFSIMYVPSKIFVNGDITATANNLLANELLFRFGIVGESIVFIIEIVLLALLYRMFKSVNKTVSLIAMLSRLSMTVIQGINIINYLLALALIKNQSYILELGINQTNSLISLLFDSHNFGVFVWQIFFGFHLIALGYVAYKSKYLPKQIGILLMFASLGYLFDSYTKIIAPNNKVLITVTTIFLVVSTVGELAFTFWLLIRGLNSNAIKESRN